MKQLVVISGKGGTGKTSITAALAGVGPAKVLADCDVDAADLHLVLTPNILETHDFYSGELPVVDRNLCTECGVCVEHCRFEAITEDIRVLEEHCEGCGVCSYVCPAGAITPEPRKCGVWMKSKTRFGTMIHAALGAGQENSGKMVTHVRGEAAKAAEEEGIDYLVIDGSPGVGCPVIASLTGADMALLVIEPSVSAIHDAKRVYSLTKHFKIPACAVINKAGLNPDLEREVEEFCKENSLPLAGAFPYDSKFTKAQIAKKTIAEFDPNGLGAIVDKVWSEIQRYLDE